MDFFVYVIIAIIFIIVWCVYFAVHAQHNKEKIDSLIAQSAYIPDIQLQFWGGRMCVCQADRKVMIVYPSKSTVISYDDILSVEMFVDGKSTYGRSVGKVVGASMMGGVIGAMCVNQDEKKTYSDLHVDIGTRIIGMPTITLNFIGFETDDISQERRDAMNVVNVIKAIIDENERFFQTNLAAAQASALAQSLLNVNENSMVSSSVSVENEVIIASQNAAENPKPLDSGCRSSSIADEIRSFAKLLEDGIITEAEFNDFKASLLSGKKS